MEKISESGQVLGSQAVAGANRDFAQVESRAGMSATGHELLSRHVRDDGSFHRKQPWGPFRTIGQAM
jgi:hypothetical protein